MNPTIHKMTTFLRLLCVFSVVAVGLASIIGSGDDNGSSTTYHDVSLPLDFDQIDVVFDEEHPTPTTKFCTDTTTMLDEFLEAANISDTENLRVIDSTITSLQINYRSVWTNVSSIQDIFCSSTIEGDWDGSIDTRRIEFGNWIGWADANDVNSTTRVAFENYSKQYNNPFQLCVSCDTSNLFNSYTLGDQSSMDMDLTIAEDNIEPLESTD